MRHVALRIRASRASAGRLGVVRVDPNLPGTEAGISAVEETVTAGLPVNVTLLFSLDRHRRAAEAYVRGLRRLRGSGGDLRSVESVAPLSCPGSTRRPIVVSMRSVVTMNSRGASRSLTPSWPTRRISRCSTAPTGASLKPPCLPAALSVGVDLDQDDAYRDVRYLEELIGPDTVNTLQLGTIAAVLDHARARDVAGGMTTRGAVVPTRCAASSMSLPTVSA